MQTECEAGYYCSGGQRFECGSENFYCPAGSISQQSVLDGFTSGPEGSLATLRSTMDPCPLGFFCISGIRTACEAGTFSSSTGGSSSSCSGDCLGRCSFSSTLCVCPSVCVSACVSVCLCVCVSVRLCVSLSVCPLSVSCLYPSFSRLVLCLCIPFPDPSLASWLTAGYYCPPGSGTATEVPCGNSTVFCPTGSGTPRLVTSGHYSTGGGDSTTRTSELECPRGSYCHDGEVVLCPPGKYGDVVGASSEAIGCSHECPAGSYCPEGTSAADLALLACGSVRFFCPAGVCVSMCVWV